MFKINRKLEYALISLKHMNGKHQGELTTAKEICNAYGAPFDATARVLQVLAQKGVLGVEHGAHGGYLVQRDLNRVTLHDLCEWILGPMKLADCLSEEGEECTMNSECNIIGPIRNLNLKLREFYQELSVRELLEGRGHHEKKHKIEEKFIA